MFGEETVWLCLRLDTSNPSMHVPRRPQDQNDAGDYQAAEEP